jgi:hypothetical protein
VRFLVALAQAHSRITVAAFEDLPDVDHGRAVHKAFLNDPQHSEAKSVLRELAITAPDHVYRAALPVYEQLRVLRDTLALPSVTPDSDQYKEVGPQRFFAGLEALQQMMRDDLRPVRRDQDRRPERARIFELWSRGSDTDE